MGKSKKFTKQSYRKCLQESIDTGVAFIDQEFKAAESSLFAERRFLSDVGVGRVVWKRPLELAKDPHLVYREKIGPNVEVEIPVGTGPNQSLLTAAAAVARDKSLVYRTFRGQLVPKDQYFLQGVFKIFVWNWGNWVKVIIDDKLPTDGEKLVFSSSRCGTVFWLPLLEKALAKLYGSYELLTKNCDLPAAFTLLTGYPVEVVLFASDSEQNMFRLMAEELDKGSLLCVRSQSAVSTTSSDVRPDSYYLLSSVKKPNFGSFKKKVTASSAVISLIPTAWQPEELKSMIRRKDIFLKVDQFSSCLHSVLICHPKKKFSTVYGSSDSQFIFDISASTEEVLIELTQQKLHGLEDIWFVIHRVEVNREYKLSRPGDGIFATEAKHQRSLSSRISLTTGRYILIPKSMRETNFMIRISNSHLRETSRNVGDKEWTLTFLAKSPAYVTRALVFRVFNLEKSDPLRSLNPYCKVTLGKEEVRSHVCRSTSNPDFEGFGCIFYHTKLKNILLEVFSQGLFKDVLIGSLCIPLEVTVDDKTTESRNFDLTNKSGSVTGSIELRIETYDDIHKI